MIATDNAAGETLRADVCIVGGGPAAISVALKLMKTRAQVVILVGGGAKRETASDQDLNRGVIDRPGSHENLEENRRRVFGGATSVWGGRCIPFDPLDFKVRPWVPESGWPFSYDHIEPFYRTALELCRAGTYNFDSREVLSTSHHEIIPGMDSHCLESWHMERWSPPINFAAEFREKLVGADNVKVFLNCHLLEFVSRDRKEEITVARAVSRGTRFEVSAKKFVLATGGIENARLLLASKSNLHPYGVGNERDLVGRYYQAHPHGSYLLLAPKSRRQLNYEYERDATGVFCRRRWWIPEETQRRLGINNIIFQLDRTDPALGHRDAAFSAVFVAKAALGVARAQGVAKKWAKLKSSAPAMRQHLATVAKDGSRALPRLIAQGRGRMASDRRLPSVLPSPDSKYLGLYYQAEQVPNRDSRITLSADQADDYGVARALIHIAFSEQDVHTITEAHRLFVSHYRAANAGDLIYDEQGLDEYLRRRSLNFNSAGHHIGTTRMARSAEKGVVDENGRVHGSRNLYVAGSSVFPTGGHANPTLTIVAMALRLGDHLAQQFAQQSGAHLTKRDGELIPLAGSM
jgi:choline dehydrogenase-like flavoprotein